MEITGEVVEIKEPRTWEENTFTDVVVKTEENYPQEIPISFMTGKVDQQNIKH